MKKDIQQVSYSEKDVFVGIDVHKKTYSVVARVDNEVVKRWTTVASPQGLAEQLLKYFERAKILPLLRCLFCLLLLGQKTGS